MAHRVKCTVCGQQFDRDTVQAVKAGPRRYAHYRCYPEGELVPLANPVDEDQLKLEEYIANLLGDDYNIGRVKKQIKDYKEQYNYSYSGMLKTLIWFYDIRGNSKEKANGGIGIIPFVYKDALNYFYNLHLAQLKNREIKTHEIKTKVVTIPAPSVRRAPIKLFNINEVEDEDING